MPNPYHDETGKFCSKTEMFNGVLRLQLAGKTDEAARLFMEYKEAENATAGNKASSAGTASTDSGETPASVNEAKPSTPEEQQLVQAENARANETVNELFAFFDANNITDGTAEYAGEAERAYQRLWDRGDSYSTYTSYSPGVRDQAQRIFNFYDEDGTEKVLFAYNQGLYISTESLDDSWGSATKHGYDTKPAQAGPFVDAAQIKTSYKVVDQSPRSYVSNGFAKVLREKGEVVESSTTEETYGRYDTVTVYKFVEEDGTERYYRRSHKFSSWDNGVDEDTTHWNEVEPYRTATFAHIRFTDIDS